MYLAIILIVIAVIFLLLLLEIIKIRKILKQKYSISKKDTISNGEGMRSEKDEKELLEEAKEIVINTGKASTSLLQRRLRIGYGQAASVLDMLEETGIVGPPNGSSPRIILKEDK